MTKHLMTYETRIFHSSGISIYRILEHTVELARLICFVGMHDYECSDHDKTSHL